MNALRRTEMAALCLVMLAGLAARADMRTRLKRMIIPKMEFEEVPVAEVFAWLRAETRRLEPDEEAINFFVRLGERASKRTVTVSFTRLPLEDVLRYLCELTGLGYKLDGKAILIYDRAAVKPGMETRTYPVKAGAMDGRRPGGEK